VDGVPCGKAFLTKRVRGLSFSCGSVGVFFCPAGSEPRRSGCASGAALRPALACDPACGGTQPGVRTLAVPLPCMKRSVGASVSTRRSGRSVPARFGVMAPCARGADLPAALRFATHRHDLCRHTGKAVTPGHPTALREGGFQSAGAAGGKSFRSPRVPDARAALGRRRRSITRTPRGPGADRALRSRAKECGAAAAGETQGRTQPPTAPAQQSCHAVEEKELAAHPLGGLNTPTHHSPRLHAGSGPPPALRVGFVPPQGAPFE
jgi:hypothetical protein